MRCSILGCEHSRKTPSANKGSSWYKLRVCTCCAYNLYWLNPHELFIKDYWRKPIKKCQNPKGAIRDFWDFRKLIIESLRDNGPMEIDELRKVLIQNLPHLKNTRLRIIQKLLMMKKDGLIDRFGEQIVLKNNALVKVVSYTR